MSGAPGCMTTWLVVEGVGILLYEECCRRIVGLLCKEVIMMESSSGEWRECFAREFYISKAL